MTPAKALVAALLIASLIIPAVVLAVVDLGSVSKTQYIECVCSDGTTVTAPLYSGEVDTATCQRVCEGKGKWGPIRSSQIKNNDGTIPWTSSGTSSGTSSSSSGTIPQPQPQIDYYEITCKCPDGSSLVMSSKTGYMDDDQCRRYCEGRGKYGSEYAYAESRKTVYYTPLVTDYYDPIVVFVPWPGETWKVPTDYGDPTKDILSAYSYDPIGSMMSSTVLAQMGSMASAVARLGTAIAQLSIQLDSLHSTAEMQSYTINTLEDKIEYLGETITGLSGGDTLSGGAAGEEAKPKKCCRCPFSGTAILKCSKGNFDWKKVPEKAEDEALSMEFEDSTTVVWNINTALTGSIGNNKAFCSFSSDYITSVECEPGTAGDSACKRACDVETGKDDVKQDIQNLMVAACSSLGEQIGCTDKDGEMELYENDVVNPSMYMGTCKCDAACPAGGSK